jgi:hypothetical protein
MVLPALRRHPHGMSNTNFLRVDREFTPRRSAIPAAAGGVAVLAMSLLLSVGPALGDARNDNNGNGGAGGVGSSNVKVHDASSGLEALGTDNEPHVCDFWLEFSMPRPFEAGTWTLESWAPTGDGSTVASGPYNTDGDGTDASSVIHVVAGHYRIEWAATGETVTKKKTFWVDAGCYDTSSPAQSPVEIPAGEPAGSAAESPASESPASESPASESPSEQPSAGDPGSPAEEPAVTGEESPAGEPSSPAEEPAVTGEESPAGDPGSPAEEPAVTGGESPAGDPGSPAEEPTSRAEESPADSPAEESPADSPTDDLASPTDAVFDDAPSLDEPPAPTDDQNVLSDSGSGNESGDEDPASPADGLGDEASGDPGTASDGSSSTPADEASAGEPTQAADSGTDPGASPLQDQLDSHDLGNSTMSDTAASTLPAPGGLAVTLGLLLLVAGHAATRRARADRD